MVVLLIVTGSQQQVDTRSHFFSNPFILLRTLGGWKKKHDWKGFQRLLSLGPRKVSLSIHSSIHPSIHIFYLSIHPPWPPAIYPLITRIRKPFLHVGHGEPRLRQAHPSGGTPGCNGDLSGSQNGERPGGDHRGGSHRGPTGFTSQGRGAGLKKVKTLYQKKSNTTTPNTPN